MSHAFIISYNDINSFRYMSKIINSTFTKLITESSMKRDIADDVEQSEYHMDEEQFYIYFSPVSIVKKGSPVIIWISVLRMRI